MSALPNTVRVHQALAKSHPEPIDSGVLSERLALSSRAIQRALQRCTADGTVRQVRCMSARQGYGYTVVTE